ncbi:EpsG family protein [Enterococcus faecium]|nr:EpsG family protein [Enterococcus faecium]
MLLLFFLIYCFCLTIFYRENNNILSLVLLLPFLIFGSLRHYSVGNDSIEYARVYQIIAGNGVDIFKDRYEIGFLKLNELLNVISHSYTLLFTITIIVTLYSLYILLKNYALMPGFSIAMYFLLRYYDMSLNVVRLSMAIAITMLATYQLLKNRYVLFTFLVILASTFHRTALVYLIAIFIWKFNIRINRKSLVVLSSGTLILFIVFDTILKIVLNIFPIYSYYLTSAYFDGNVKIATLFNIAIFSIFTLLAYKISVSNKIKIDKELDIEEFNKIEGFFLTMITLGIFINILSINFNLFNRVGDYFLLYLIIYLPNQMVKLKDKYASILVIYGFYIILICYYLIIIIYRPEWNKVYPYLFFWQ